MTLIEHHYRSACCGCAVRNYSLCNELAPAQLGALSAISRIRVFEPGQVVAFEGDTQVLGKIVSGLIMEKKAMADGREQIVSLLFPADFVGNTLDGRSDATAHAVATTQICLFDRAGFERLAMELPSLKMAMLRQAQLTLSNARDWMLLLGQKTAHERVATFLLRLAVRQSGPPDGEERHLDDGIEVDIPITRAQIASYLGLTIETVSRRLTAMREARLIDFKSHRLVRLCDVERLRIATGGSRQLN